jgi:hypothetical protein
MSKSEILKIKYEIGKQTQNYAKKIKLVKDIRSIIKLILKIDK